MNLSIGLLFSTIFFTCKINAQSTSNVGLIIGPKTPVYVINYPKRDYLKVEHAENILKTSPAYNYYKDPSNRKGTYFIRILIVVDFMLHGFMDKEYITEEVLNQWNKLDKYFEKLTSIKIKFVISGIVVIPKVRDLWGKFTRHSYLDMYYRDLITVNCYDKFTLKNNLENWFANNPKTFYKLGTYDLLIFMSALPFLDNEVISPYFSFNNQPFKKICSKDNHNHKSSFFGGFVSAGSNFDFNAAQLLAEIFGVPRDGAANCGKHHVLDPNWDPDFDKPGKTWSQCSVSAFGNIFSDSKLSCLRNIIYEEEASDYDDE